MEDYLVPFLLAFVVTGSFLAALQRIVRPSAPKQEPKLVFPEMTPRQKWEARRRAR